MILIYIIISISQVPEYPSLVTEVYEQSPRLLSYLENYWPNAGGFSVVNAIGNAIAA